MNEITIHVGFDESRDEALRQAHELIDELEKANALLKTLRVNGVELSLSMERQTDTERKRAVSGQEPQYRLHIINGDILGLLGDRARELNTALEKASSILQELAESESKVLVSGTFLDEGGLPLND